MSGEHDQIDIAKIARLARLRLTDEEAATLRRQLGSILGFVEQLKEVETDGVEPLAHPLPLRNCFRADELRPSLPPDEALANAPKRAAEFYSVPAILE